MKIRYNVNVIALVIIIMLLLGGMWAWHISSTEKLKAENKQYSATIEKLMKQLSTKPTVKIVYVKAQQVTNATVPNATVSEVPSAAVPVPVQLSKQEYCKIAQANGVEPVVKITNGLVECDAYFCKDTGTITILGRGEQAIEQAAKRSLITQEFLIGYEFNKGAFSLGYSPVNWYGMITGVNVASDFKTAKDTEAGVFIGWQPEWKGWWSSFSVAAGPSYSLNRQWNAQFLLQFAFLRKQ